MAIKYRLVETVRDEYVERGGNHKKPHPNKSRTKRVRALHIYEAYNDGKVYDLKGKR